MGFELGFIIYLFKYWVHKYNKLALLKILDFVPNSNYPIILISLCKSFTTQ